MRLIATILVVALSDAAVYGQDFGGHALFVRTADADPGKKNAREFYKSALSIIERTREKEREKERRYNCCDDKLITNEWFKIH